jgi:Ca2+-binding RTX toxin-like protein
VNRTTRSRRAVVAVALGLAAGLVGACVTAVAPSAGALSAPTPNQYLRRWASTNGGTVNDQVYTRDQAIDVARRFDLIVALRTTFPDYVADMKAANPNLQLITYSNGAFALAKEGTRFPDAWYLRDANGRKVTSVAWGNYLMDPGKLGWRQEAVHECNAFINASGYDGCYLDDLGSGNLDSGNLSAPPVNPRTGQLYTRLDWINDASNLGAYVETNLGKPVIVNGLNNGKKYFDATVQSKRLLDGVDGGNAEGFLRGETTPVDQFRSEADWLQEINMLTDAASRGRSIVAMTKTWVPASADQVERLRRYAYASFLLGTDGHQYLYFNAEGPGQPPAASSLDDMQLGMPLESFAKRDGVYQRRFSEGLALVNPTDVSVTVPLTANYTDEDGNAVDTLTMGPNSGDLLKLAVSAPSDVTCRGLTPTIVGTPGPDTISGTPGPDVIVGLAGDDVITGLGGDDTICGGAGNDVLIGNDGDDYLAGGSGDDRLEGRAGLDILQGGKGNDTVLGGGADDRLWGGPDTDSCDGGGHVVRDVAHDCETMTNIP